MRPRLLFGLLAACFWVAASSPAWPQTNQRHAVIPSGQRLSAAQVRAELEDRLGRNSANTATIWNTGYDFYRNYPRNQDTALAIKEGFLGALRRQTDPARRQVLLQAAIYWEKVHDYGVTNVPVGLDPNTRSNIYYGGYAKFSTLAPAPAGRPPARSTGRGDWPGQSLSRRHPYKGRPDNPYPGPYYPGIYPP